MAINREQRGKVADNLAAFMRGEITDAEYLDRGRQILDEIKRSNTPDTFALYNACFEWMNPSGGDHTLRADETTWNAMRCRLAFLASDLEMKREGHDPIPGAGIWAVLGSITVVILLVYLHVVWIGLGMGAGIFCSSFWCGAGFGAALAIDIHARLCFRKRRPDPFHPFNDATQFREHQHLLERFNLPTYDAKHLQLPTKNTYSALTCIAGGIGVVLLTLLQGVLPMIFGPLLLIGALKPGRRPRYVAVKGDES